MEPSPHLEDMFLLAPDYYRRLSGGHHCGHSPPPTRCWCSGVREYEPFHRAVRPSGVAKGKVRVAEDAEIQGLPSGGPGPHQYTQMQGA